MSRAGNIFVDNDNDNDNNNNNDRTNYFTPCACVWSKNGNVQDNGNHIDMEISPQ